MLLVVIYRSKCPPEWPAIPYIEVVEEALCFGWRGSTLKSFTMVGSLNASLLAELKAWLTKILTNNRFSFFRHHTSSIFHHRIAGSDFYRIIQQEYLIQCLFKGL